MTKLILIVHNIRSAHNVGSLLRTADGLGVERVYLSGYSPHPPRRKDHRLPHEQEKILRQIHKTALGAEDSQPWSYIADPLELFPQLRKDGYSIVCLEQTPESENIEYFHPPKRLALIVGNEVTGINPGLTTECDAVVHIPMRGKKESFNVTVAAAIAIYTLSR